VTTDKLLREEINFRAVEVSLCASVADKEPGHRNRNSFFISWQLS